jgi:putative transposase
VKQIYVASYYRSGYIRFMRYINDVLDHPKRLAIEKRLEIIQFHDD